MKELEKQASYQQLLAQINSIYQEGRKQATIAVNSHLVQTYWVIGQYIVEFEQQGEKRAVYGNQLIKLRTKPPSSKSTILTLMKYTSAILKKKKM